ncbi:MAG: 2-hydroxyglutaryl-CoA dehydratase, partial [Deltaproteobacteria bacterium]|nr:2-hydroxyglutaryl-CoA dehydratase [Deltaproteobacteria bacterium]
MPVLGIDVGAATTKAVVMADGEILSWYIMQTGHDINEASETVISQTLAKTTFSKDELDYIVSTGYGRNGVRFANKAITEILCHAKGAYWMMPETR